MNEKNETCKPDIYNAALKLKLNCFLHLALEVLPSSDYQLLTNPVIDRIVELLSQYPH